MQRVELNIGKFKPAMTFKTLGAALTFGASTALATNCIFPPSMEGEWQPTCSLFGRGANSLTFARSSAGIAVVRQNGHNCTMVELYDEDHETFLYKVENQSDCSRRASSNLVATYVFQDGETRLDVTRNGVTNRFVDCKLYVRQKLASGETAAYAPR